MPKFSSILEYYSRKDVQELLLEISKNREVVGVYPSGNFDKRPNVLTYPDDILQMVKKGVISFHGSLERWNNPMSLSTDLSLADLDKLRIGWDLIIDPDCPDFEISKIAVRTIVEALEDHGIKNYSIKSTGGKGFHIGLLFESFPKVVNKKPIETQYPDIPRAIIDYLKDYIREELKEKILTIDNPFSIAERLGKKIEEITDKNGLDPFKVVVMDSGLISSRHLFRLPYSLHETSSLVSLPLELSELDKFKKEDASIEKLRVKTKFLLEKPIQEEGTGLLIEALDWVKTYKPEEPKATYEGPIRKIRYFSKKYFPPCIQKLLEGKLADGRKRSVFILITFLRNMGWTWEQIDKELIEWNEKNLPPLRINYIKTQLRWHKTQKRNILPPNCDNENFYKDIGVYCGDEFHKNVKNPINYSYRKLKRK